MTASIPVHHREDFFPTQGGLQLFEQSWAPPVPRAVIVIVHGYAEHSSRYAETALYLARQGYALQAFDLQGHGRSPGRRCFIRAFDDCLEDLDLLLQRTAPRWTGLPCFLLGHSLGGLIAVLFAIEARADLSGLILSAPSVKLGGDFSPLKVKAALRLGRWLPRLPTTRFNSASISRDPAVVQAYRDDPLVNHDRIPARTASEIIRAIGRAQLNLERITLPLLVMHGGNDQVTDSAGSRELYTRAGSKDKSFRLWEGLHHEIMNEPEREQVLAEIADWLRERTHRAVPEDQPPVTRS